MLQRHHELPQNTHPGMVIIRVQFDFCTFPSFRGIKTDNTITY